MFRNMQDFTTAMDGGTIQSKRDDIVKPEFPNELNDYLYGEKDGSVSAVNGFGERVQFRDWRSFWDTARGQL